MKGSFLIVYENYQHYQQFNHSVIEIFYMGILCVMRRFFTPNKEWDVDLRDLQAGVYMQHVRLVDGNQKILNSPVFHGSDHGMYLKLLMINGFCASR